MAGEEFYNEEIAKLGDSLFRETSSVSAEIFNDYFFSIIGKSLQNDQTILDIGTGNGYVLGGFIKKVCS